MHKQDIYTMMAGQYEGALEVPLEVLEPYDTVDGKVFYN